MENTAYFRFQLGRAALLIFLAAVASFAAKFQWNWHEAQELTWKLSLRNAAVANEERQSLTDAIAEQLRVAMDDFGIDSEEQLRKSALDTRVKKIDLNGDGKPEVIAQGMSGCSPTGNCPFWIFRRATKGYKLILDGFGQTFTVQHSGANGYLDIVVGLHGSATESDLTVYRYSGGSYRGTACYRASWSVLEGEAGRKVSEPRITPCSGR